jgi:hypothetical protein
VPDPDPKPAAKPDRPRRAAWQPFTGPGVAAFAGASTGRTVGFLLAFACAAALALGVTVRTAWWPVIGSAADAFPEAGASIGLGRLVWPRPDSAVLAQGPALGIAVRPAGSDSPGRTADLQVELAARGVRVAGVAGYLELPWPREWAVALDRNDVVAAWGAWRRPLLCLVAALVLACLPACWTVLAALHALPCRLLAWILRRELSLAGAWRLAAAGLLSGATLLSAAFLAYGFGFLPWTGLVAAFALHTVTGWLWTGWGLLELPPRKPRRPPSANPFAG